MTLRSILALFAAAALMSVTQAESPPPPAAPSTIPADIQAMLAEHRGSWRTEGWIVEGDKRTPAKASWECKAAVNGLGNVCTWYHEWSDRPHDSALEIMGYDPRLKALSITRVLDTGVVNEPVAVIVSGKTMTVEKKFTMDGKPTTMLNKIVVVKPGEWTQQVTFESGGKLVREMTMTHRRVD